MVGGLDSYQNEQLLMWGGGPFRVPGSRGLVFLVLAVSVCGGRQAGR